MYYDKYKIRVPFVTHAKDPAGHAAFVVAEKQAYETFKADAIDEAGLKDHPKAEKAFALAWSSGHAYGYPEVFNHLLPLAELLLD